MTEAKTSLTREALKRRCERRYLETELDGVPVRIQSLTIAERSEYGASFSDASGKVMPSAMKERQIRLIAMCLVDEEGTRIYSDVKELRELDSGFAEALYVLCDTHCKVFSENTKPELKKKDED